MFVLGPSVFVLANLRLKAIDQLIDGGVHFSGRCLGLKPLSADRAHGFRRMLKFVHS